MGAKTEKNFIQSNALDAALAVPKKPERNIVDDRRGDKFPLDQSGLAPKYVMKKVGIRLFTLQLPIEHLSLRILVKFPSTSKHVDKISKRPNKNISRIFQSISNAERCVRWMNRNVKPFSMVMINWSRNVIKTLFLV